MDGFRALAHVGEGETRLVSRQGNVYKRFTELAAAIHIQLDCEAALDWETVMPGSARSELSAKRRSDDRDASRDQGTSGTEDRTTTAAESDHCGLGPHLVARLCTTSMLA